MVEDVRRRLLEAAGRTTQDLGLGRIVGQTLVYVYLSPDPCSLDDLEGALGLSKAAVSIAARQLEALGLLQRVWKKGDRRSYYRTVDNFGAAVQKGLLALLRTKMTSLAEVLEQAAQALDGLEPGEADARTRFLIKRVDRARRLRDRTARILNSPVLRLLGR